MATPSHAERPYRSHLQPACTPCRRRKSRCQTEANASTCLMCKLHKSDCSFPEIPRSNSTHASEIADTRRKTKRQARKPAPAALAQQIRARSTRSGRCHSSRVENITPSLLSDSTELPVFSHSTEESVDLNSIEDENLNLHIVGPAATDDSRVLTDYLAGVPGAPRTIRMAIPVSSGSSKTILFTPTQKRPVGMSVHRSPSAEKLEIIEKLLEPLLGNIIEL